MKQIFLEIKLLEIAIPKTVPDRKCISTYLECYVRQLLLLSYSATLVETPPKIYLYKFWLAGRTSSLEQLKFINNNINDNNNNEYNSVMDYT